MINKYELTVKIIKNEGDVQAFLLSEAYYKLIRFIYSMNEFFFVFL
jgi:hypothetical protein